MQIEQKYQVTFMLTKREDRRIAIVIVTLVFSYVFFHLLHSVYCTGSRAYFGV